MATTVPGKLRVSNDVIADLAGYAALECYGVVGMALTDEEQGVARLLPIHRLRKGIEVSLEDGHITVDLHVILEQGVNMSSVAANLVSTVKFILDQIAELTHVVVRVHVEGMRTH
ncbi:MAG: Asp23/Gls24 family envelope stress response protein [Atopobiaceae bacterium]|nr:Asp23/Gls24 family envelope stress response protein [Atopobiaceae bacterium]MBR3316074.1 Asp23/Gls24 family envelope stress response protein [Atopobiaceae bacterium]